MSDDNKTWPYRQHGDYREDDDDGSGRLDIVRTKSTPGLRLRRWRRAASVLNASWRFRYTLDLKKEEERKQLTDKIRMHAQVIRAAITFQEAAKRPFDSGTSASPFSPTRTVDFGISSEELVSISRQHDLSLLQQNGGVKGLSEKLKSNLEKGVPGDETDLINRKEAFGSNTYTRKKGKSFWRFVWDACRDTTLITLMATASASLVQVTKTEGIKEGWYDGGTIALAILIVIIFTAASDYKQSLQFQNLNKEKQNIQVEVIRSGRRVKVSLFEIVAGDVVPLKIGDQVPADGLVISSHSLSIDESSITGESKIVHKDSIRAPFLMSGCKVADGYGTMLVTSVGINTEWGLLMACVTEDNGEERPLQAQLNGVATFIGMGLAVAIAVLDVRVARFFSGNTKDPDGRVQFTSGKTKVGDAIYGFIKMFTVAVAIIVIAVLEGLPLAVTLTLAYSMGKMMADKALVRRLSAFETIGSAATICSDKTGTLTLNQMTVVEAYACGKKIDPPDNKSILPPTAICLLIEGDNLQTARAIALECGILDSNGDATEPNIIEGKTFRNLTATRRLEVADRISVMGRSSPIDKLLLVQALRKGRHVVAVTGDGTNDAPALHEADIGLAMGIQGTEVAKESPDIIILDDGFASVIKVVQWGRSVYANIQSIIQFQLTVNVAALIINVVAAVSSGNVPLNAVQLLWVNLIMDPLGALALATEPPMDHLMHRPPVGRRKPLITNIMWRNLLIQALYQVTVLLVLNFWGTRILNLEHDTSNHALQVKNTLIFNAFVFCQVFNEFNARKPDEIIMWKEVTKNRVFMGIVGLEVVLQVIIISFLGKFTSTVHLSWKLWLVSIAIAFISWPLADVGQLIPVPERPFSEIFAVVCAYIFNFPSSP